MSRGSEISGGTGSRAAVTGHPIHPMLVPLPITAFVAAFLGDVAFLVTEDNFWAQLARWSLGFGVLTGAVAALAGLVDFVSLKRARTLGKAWLHGAANLIVLTASLVNFLIRRSEPAEAILFTGVLISGLVLILLAVSGWLGGELVYRHGIGVSREIKSSE